LGEISSDIIRGHIDAMILKLLAAGDKYGYEICKLIQTSSKGEYELKEASMYSSLKRLEQEEKITAYWGDETQGGRRKYYRITDKGKGDYSRQKTAWEHTKKILDRLI
jgi:PadR family transcriptional regulator